MQVKLRPPSGLEAASYYALAREKPRRKKNLPAKNAAPQVHRQPEPEIPHGISVSQPKQGHQARLVMSHRMAAKAAPVSVASSAASSLRRLARSACEPRTAESQKAALEWFSSHWLLSGVRI